VAVPQRSSPVIGVRDAHRLRAVAEAALCGHLGDAALDAVVATVQLASGSPMAVINIVTHDLQTYPAEVGVGASCTTVPDHLSFCAEVVETGHELLVPDATTHPVYRANPLVVGGLVGAYAGVPLVEDGAVLGTVSIFDPVAKEFSPATLAILRHQAVLASSVLALRRSARTDVLTGLPNRALFADRLDRALARLQRHASATCVMYLDVDHFKAINDAHGHAVGDQVLLELGRRLTRVLRPADTLARLGGDELAVLCEDLGGPADVEVMAERLLSATAGPWELEGSTVTVSLSIGIALTGSASTDASALVRDADAAMYVAKKTLGPSWVLAPINDEPDDLTAWSRRSPRPRMSKD
jgi:diguanylate cyclase (GGDEF)-like protein